MDRNCESCKNYEAKIEDVKVDFTSKFIQLRSSGKYKDRAFFLRRHYDWEIKEDDEGSLILVPIPKK